MGSVPGGGAGVEPPLVQYARLPAGASGSWYRTKAPQFTTAIMVCSPHGNCRALPPTLKQTSRSTTPSETVGITPGALQRKHVCQLVRNAFRLRVCVCMYVCVFARAV